MGINYLNFFNNSFIFQINLESSGLMPMEVPSYIDDCEAVANGFGLTGSERDFEQPLFLIESVWELVAVGFACQKIYKAPTTTTQSSHPFSLPSQP